MSQTDESHRTGLIGPMDPLPTGAAGVMVGSRSWERLIGALRDGIVALTARTAPEELFAPPVIARSVVERAGYVRTFPHLLGTVSSFAGDTRRWRSLADLADEHGDWHREQQISDVVLLPATCYHVYPLLEGVTLAHAKTLLVHAQCFRQEASAEPGRLRSFRMTELVRIAVPDDTDRWRLSWRDHAAEWLTDLGLDVRMEPASDPFFGPADRLMRSSQLEQELKWEMQVEVVGGLRQAVASSNYHQDHFASAFRIGGAGGPVHTACVAFGLERIALALTLVHGPRLDDWPAALRQQ
jgi:seryl-tRNA synthetase